MNAITMLVYNLQNNNFIPYPIVGINRKLSFLFNKELNSSSHDAVHPLIDGSSTLYNRLKGLSQASNINESEAQPVILAAFQDKSYAQLSVFLCAIFDRLSDKQLKEIFDKLFIQHSDNLESLNNKIKKIVTLEKLQHIYDINIEGMIKGRAYFAQSEVSENRAYQKQRVFRLANLFLCTWITYVVSIIFHYFPIAALTPSIIAQTHPETVAHLYKTCFKRIKALFNLVINLNHRTESIPATGAIISTGLLVLSSFTYGYFKWFKEKTCSSTITKFEDIISKIDLTQPPSTARLDKMEEVIDALAQGEYVCLVGQSGAGKTQLVKDLAYYIALNQFPSSLGNKADFLKNRKLFSISSAQLTSSEKGIRKFKGEVDEQSGAPILFVDEIHDIFQKTATDGKFLFDATNVNPLQFCIGATTQDDYDQYMASDPAIVRRFRIIKLESMETADTLKALKDTMQQKAPDLTADDQALNLLANLGDPKTSPLFENLRTKLTTRNLSSELIDKFIKQPQPNLAKRLLKLACIKARNEKKRACQEQLKVKGTELRALEGHLERQDFYQQNMYLGSKQGSQTLEKIKQAKAEIIKINHSIVEAQHQADQNVIRLKQLKKFHQTINAQASRLAAKLEKGETLSGATQMDFFLQMQHSKALQTIIDNNRTPITADLVEQVILENISNI